MPGTSIASTALRLTASTLLYGGLLFGTAGTLAWPQAWAYMALLVAILATYVAIVMRLHPDLIAERTHPPSDAKRWDKPLVTVMAVIGPLALIVVSGLERRHDGPAPALSLTSTAGLVLVAAGGALANWAVAANRFFSALVRIQHDRGHRVVNTGPYRVLRHPGYAGSIATMFGAALALGSRWALGVAAVITAATVVRTRLEDRTLHAELEGYEEYAKRVRFRLLPGIW